MYLSRLTQLIEVFKVIYSDVIVLLPYLDSHTDDDDDNEDEYVDDDNDEDNNDDNQYKYDVDECVGDVDEYGDDDEISHHIINIT